MHWKAEAPPKSKGTFKCNSFHTPSHMAICKRDSDKTSFICKASAGAEMAPLYLAHQDLQSGTANVF